MPVFPMTVRGYFKLNKHSGEIEGIYSIPLEDEDEQMNTEDHNSERFFNPWADRNREPDQKKTQEAIAQLQQARYIKELEKEFDKKYKDAETVEDLQLPEIDLEQLYVTNLTTLREVREDFVSTGSDLFLTAFSNDELRDHYKSKLSDISVNYSTVCFPNWKLTGASA